MKKLLLFLFAAFVTLPSFAQASVPFSFKYMGHSLTYELDSLTDDIIFARVVGPDESNGGKEGLIGDLTIPSVVYYKGKPYNVCRIWAGAFDECTGLTSVEIPNSVIWIDSMAFAGCNGITSLKLGNSVSTIGFDAFGGCTGLTSVEIPNSVTKIENNAFYCCNGLTYLKLGNSVSTIGDYAFGGCTSLTSVEIPDALITIGHGTFSSCRSLTSVTFGKSLTTIGSCAFESCTSLTSVEIPNSVTLIRYRAFMDCTGLITLKLGNSITKIDDGAFSGCTGLTSVEIPNSVTIMGYDVFHFCTNLTSIKLGNSIKKIGSSAFYGCTQLSITEYASIESACQIEYEDNDANPLYFSKKLIIDGCEVTELNIPSTVKYIGERAFVNCKSLQSVTIPGSVTEIGNNAFLNCYNLNSVILPNSISIIKSGTFESCPLSEIIIPPSVKTIEWSAFDSGYGSSSLSKVIIGPNVRSIEDYAFYTAKSSDIYTTSPTPPSATKKSFCQYSGTLHVVDDQAIDSYRNSAPCWNQFSSYSAMKKPVEMKLEGSRQISGQPGDKFPLSAKLLPEDVTLPQVFWRSTNPDIASVDENGVVTIHADIEEMVTMSDNDDIPETSCKIIAESLYADGPVAEVEIIRQSSGVENVGYATPLENETLRTSPVEVYNLSGLRIADSTDNLSPGIYIVRRGNTVNKTAVK